MQAAEWGLKEGSPDLKSAGPLTFGPDGILFIGDTKAAAVVAIDTGDASGDPSSLEFNIDGLNEAVAKSLGSDAKGTKINDLAVNPLSGNVYLSVTKSDAKPALLRIDGKGKLSELGLQKAKFSKVALPNAPEDKVTGEGRRARNRRAESITDLAYADGKVLVSGLTNAPSPSTVREIAFPFAGADEGISIEIYHGAHGRLEDSAAVRTFVPFVIDGKPNLLAGFTCTPLVKFPLDAVSAGGEKIRGTTVAELGNRNQPLDMIVYAKDGKDYLLMANSARGVMKISTQDIDRKEGITERVGGGGTAGQPYETIEELQGVVQLDRLNDQYAVIIVQKEGGSQDLRTVALP
jgi:hypothetical protein